MSEQITYRKADRQDMPKVSEFRKKYFEHNPFRSCEQKYYEWKCYDNPFQPGDIWLAEIGDVIVGMRAMTPRRIKISGEVIDAVEMGDGFTHPDYQRRGIFTGITEAVKKSILDRGISIIYGSPNKNSLPGMQKMSYTQVPITLRSLAKPLNVKPLLDARWHSHLLASLFSPVLGLISATATLIGTAGSSKDVSVSQATSFPDDVDELWERASKSFDVALVRSKQYLQWRYIQNPDRYSIFIAQDKNSATAGYMIAKTCVSDGEVTGFIADYLTLGDGVFKRLLNTVLRDFSQQKTGAVHVWAVKGNIYDRIFIGSGFLAREVLPLLFYPIGLGSKLISTKYRWHFTMGDKDIV